MKSKHLSLYQKMLLIRFFEEKVENIFTSGAVSGTVHTCIGQEAAAVGICAGLNKTDALTSTHRGHGHFLAKGADPNKLMAELYGKSTGYSEGRGGSQFMADYSIGYMGANGIVGGSIPVATGMALNFKQTAKKRIAVCVFGDGAVNQGTFHESMNMAGLWKLPILFICENNLYAMSTHCLSALANPNIAAKASNYNMRGVTVDGNDLFAVQQTVKEFAKQARNGHGPTLIELKTYRFSGHSRGDKKIYRTREEEKDWQKQDPIKRFKNYLLDENIITKEDDRDIRKQVKSEVRKAVAFAEKSSYPAPESLMKGVFA